MYIGYDHQFLLIVCKTSDNSIIDRNDQLTAQAMQNMLLFLYEYLFRKENTLQSF